MARKALSATGRAIKDNEGYISWQGFGCWALDEPVQIKAGTMLRGDDPVVRVCAAQFVEADLDRSEWPTADRQMIKELAEQGIEAA